VSFDDAGDAAPDINTFLFQNGRLRRELGRRVTEHRAEVGLSHYALASALGVQRTFIEGIGRGERNLTLAHIERLARCLGVSLRPTRRRTARAERTLSRVAESAKRDFKNVLSIPLQAGMAQFVGLRAPFDTAKLDRGTVSNAAEHACEGSAAPVCCLATGRVARRRRR
jgi:predicted transcriptional regulator